MGNSVFPVHQQRSVSVSSNGTSGLEQPLKSELVALQSVILMLSSTPCSIRSVHADLGVHRHDEVETFEVDNA